MRVLRGRGAAGSVQFRETVCYSECSKQARIGDSRQAGMAELADALDLGSSAERRAGSSPVPGTKKLAKWEISSDSGKNSEFIW